jgi:hypothetical protein
LQPWSKWLRCSSHWQQTLALSISLWCCRHAECKSCEVIETSTEISKESLVDKAVHGRIGVPKSSSQRDNV